MPPFLRPMLRTAAALLIAAPLAAPALAQTDHAYPSLTVLFQSRETVIGQPLVYPTETPAELTAVIVTLQPGQETGWHTHEVPLFAHILEGVVTLNYGSEGMRVFQAGDSLLEAQDWPHNARNEGDVPVRILAVYLGAEGLHNAEAAEPAE